MKKLSQPFVDLAIAWKFNDFFQARIKLTFFYAIIIGIIIVIFSGTLSFEINEIHKKFHAENITEDNETLLDEFIDEITEKIVWTDFFIFFVALFLSYFLAGKTLRPIKNKIKEQNQFISDAAHELKNPLAAIRASGASILREKVISEKKSREVFGEILEESNRLISLTDQLLQLEGSKKQKVKKIKAKAIIHNVIRKMKPFMAQKNISITTNISDFAFQISQNDFERIIFNLLHNAIKFSHPNGNIIIELNQSGVLSIQDFGIGMSQKNIPYIFNRFYKVDSARTFNAQTGSGLGLSITKQIIDNFHGNIKVKCRKGEGCTFIVHF